MFLATAPCLACRKSFGPRKMKFIITGALGHIGSKLVRELPRFFENPDIIMIDNMRTQRFPSLFDLPESARYGFIEDDVTTMDATSYADADVVVHLAALTDATASFGRAAETEQINYAATENVAKICSSLDIPLIHASSTSVYGTQNEVVDELCDVDDLNPQSPYAETKLREESLIAKMCNVEGLRAVTFRFGTIFGASSGMRFHTAVNKFCWQAVMKQPLTVWRTAYDQKRPYLDLTDVIQAINLAVENQIFDGRIYNVVTNNSTVREVVGQIRRHVPDLHVDFVDNMIMNQLSYEVLNTRMKEIGFKPVGNLERGIAETIKTLRRSNSVE